MKSKNTDGPNFIVTERTPPEKRCCHSAIGAHVLGKGEGGGISLIIFEKPVILGRGYAWEFVEEE